MLSSKDSHDSHRRKAPDKLSESEGRRIYIHQDSFLNLAQQAVNNAEEIFLCLGKVALTKAVYQNFVEDGTMLMILEKSEAQEILEKARQKWFDPLNVLFDRLVFFSQDSSERNRVSPILEAGERIVASCYDDCYYTYSTGDAAARRMFADREKIKTLRKAVREKTGHFDLTMINGPVLFFVDPEIGCGPDCKVLYRKKQKGQGASVSSDEMIRIKMSIFQTLNSELRNLVDDMWPDANGNKHDFIEEAFKHCVSATNKGILKYK